MKKEKRKTNKELCYFDGMFYMVKFTKKFLDYGTENHALIK